MSKDIPSIGYRPRVMISSYSVCMNVCIYVCLFVYLGILIVADANLDGEVGIRCRGGYCGERCREKTRLKKLVIDWFGEEADEAETVFRPLQHSL